MARKRTAKTDPLVRLMAQGERAANFRGHRLKAWQEDPGGFKANATCTRCPMGVWVDTWPPANGIDVAGEAVALNCPNAGPFQPGA